MTLLALTGKGGKERVMKGLNGTRKEDGGWRYERNYTPLNFNKPFPFRSMNICAVLRGNLSRSGLSQFYVRWSHWRWRSDGPSHDLYHATRRMATKSSSLSNCVWYVSKEPSGWVNICITVQICAKLLSLLGISTLIIFRAADFVSN